MYTYTVCYGESQAYWITLENLTGNTLHVRGQYFADLKCGNRSTSNFDIQIGPYEKAVPKSGYLADDTGLFGRAWRSLCDIPPTYENGKKVWHNMIKSVGYGLDEVRHMDATSIKPTVSNVQHQSAVNSSSNTSPVHGNKTSPHDHEEALRRQEFKDQLNSANQQTSAAWQTVNESLANVFDALLQNSFRNSIQSENQRRNEAFSALENDIDSKTGTLENCVHCNGEGYNSCSTCTGSGKKTCLGCFGKGNTNCTLCYGTGKFLNNTCTSCNGKGSQPCATCKSTGMSYCTDCHATGKDFCDYCTGTGKRFREHLTSTTPYQSAASATKPMMSPETTSNPININKPVTKETFSLTSKRQPKKYMISPAAAIAYREFSALLSQHLAKRNETHNSAKGVQRETALIKFEYDEQTASFSVHSDFKTFYPATKETNQTRTIDIVNFPGIEKCEIFHHEQSWYNRDRTIKFMHAEKYGVDLTFIGKDAGRTVIELGGEKEETYEEEIDVYWGFDSKGAMKEALAKLKARLKELEIAIEEY